MAADDASKLISQTERLFTVRPRSLAYNPEGGGNRGTRTKLRILSTNTQRTGDRLKTSAATSFGSAAEADYVVSRLLGTGFNEFLLNNVSVAINEKVQITQTFGDSDVTYYFGKAPIIFNLSGTLIDDLDNQWFNNFVNAYAHGLRGTELAKNYELVEMILPNMEVIGSVMGFSYNQDASRDTDIQFSMQLLAKEVRPIPVLVPAALLSSSYKLIDFKKASNMKNFKTLAGINSLKTTSSQLLTLVQDPLASTSLVNNILNSPTAGGVLDHASATSAAAAPIPGLAGPVATGMESAATQNGIAGGVTGLTDNLNNAGGGSSMGLVTNPWSSGQSSDPSGLELNNIGTTLTGAAGDPYSSAKSSFVTGISPSAAAGKLLAPGYLPSGPYYQGKGTSVAGFGSSLFSPVFGVLTSITKVVKSVTGDISAIISSFTNPVNTVLRDIQGVAAQAVGVVKLIENSVQQIVNIPGRTLFSLNTTIQALKNTAGIISRAPETIAQSVKRLFAMGNLHNQAMFLSKGGTQPKSKQAVLSSGAPYTPMSGAKIK